MPKPEPITIRIIFPNTIDPTSIVGRRIADLNEAIRVKLNACAIDLLENDNQPGARAVVELSMQIHGAFRALLGEGKRVPDDSQLENEMEGEDDHS